MTIWFASGNAHKKAELAAILNMNGPTNQVLIPADAGLEFDPEETGTTFYENSLLKAQALYSLLEKNHPPLFKPGDVVIADDSGICVDALGGRPGIYSARYAGANGDKAPNAKKLESAERNALLLEELGNNPLRSARFVCAMALIIGPEPAAERRSREGSPPDHFYMAQETLEGEIVSGPNAAKGRGGFGYDPILFIPGLGRTVAELSDEEKNTISHRAKAGKIIAHLLRINS
jgi:XTP/dITP diphosphohydrolase